MLQASPERGVQFAKQFHHQPGLFGAQRVQGVREFARVGG